MVCLIGGPGPDHFPGSIAVMDFASRRRAPVIGAAHFEDGTRPDIRAVRDSAPGNAMPCVRTRVERAAGSSGWLDANQRAAGHPVTSRQLRGSAGSTANDCPLWCWGEVHVLFSPVCFFFSLLPFLPTNIEGGIPPSKNHLYVEEGNCPLRTKRSLIPAGATATG